MWNALIWMSKFSFRFLQCEGSHIVLICMSMCACMRACFRMSYNMVSDVHFCPRLHIGCHEHLTKHYWWLSCCSLFIGLTTTGKGIVKIFMQQYVNTVHDFCQVLNMLEYSIACFTGFLITLERLGSTFFVYLTERKWNA